MATGLGIYGRPLRAFEGVGTLSFVDQPPVIVNFEAGQLHDGRVILWCHSAVDNAAQMMQHSDQVTSFQGTSQEGFSLNADGQMREFGYLPEMPETYESCVMSAYEFRDLYVRTADKAAHGPAEIRFGLTNFLFVGNTPAKWQSGDTIYEALVLPLRIGDTEITLRRRPDYEDVAGRLTSLRDADVTAEAVVSASYGMEHATEAVEDLCWLLSIARGTKVNWVYADVFSSDANLIQTRHANRITKRYSPLSVIDPADEADTTRFIEQTYGRFAEIREPYELCRGTIDAYLDAKAEADFLEVRAAKLAVCLERLKHYFAAAENAEHILAEEVFAGKKDDLEKEMRKVLKGVFDSKINHDQIAAMVSHLGGLNRRSFRYIVRQLSKRIALKVSDEDLQTFVRSRNALVHRGRFACTLPAEDEQSNAHVFSSHVDEWLFMVNILDRVFLRMLGYDGLYLNRGKRPGAKELLQ